MAISWFYMSYRFCSYLIWLLLIMNYFFCFGDNISRKENSLIEDVYTKINWNKQCCILLGFCSSSKMQNIVTFLVSCDVHRCRFEEGGLLVDLWTGGVPWSPGEWFRLKYHLKKDHFKKDLQPKTSTATEKDRWAIS